MVSILGYFTDTALDHSWFSHVKKASAILDSAVEINTIDVDKQAKVLSSMINLEELCITSTSPKSRLSCDMILSGVMAKHLKGCRQLRKFTISNCQVSVKVLRRFLHNQSRPIVAVFDNVTLLRHDCEPSEQLSNILYK